MEGSSAIVRALFAVGTTWTTRGVGDNSITDSVPSAPEGTSAKCRRSSNAAPSGRLPMVSDATGFPAAESTTATPLAQADSVSFVAGS